MAAITEWTFTADVASQINEIVQTNADLPFSKAQVEMRGKGGQKRRDLTIYDRNGQPALTGEVKLPDSPDGRSPFQQALVLDAHNKANQIGVEYFFTWNVNRLVLWRTFEQGKPITERYIEHFRVFEAPLRAADDLLNPQVQDSVKQFLHAFLSRAGAILTGAQPLIWLPLDEKFIVVWEASLDPIVSETLGAIHRKYQADKRFRLALDRWMRDQQGWTLSKDEEVVRENLERAAKFTCYVLANKIIFYKALRRRFSRLRAARIPADVKTGHELQQLLEQYFDHAITVSRDYETVFRGDFGDKLPFLSDAAVDAWRSLNSQTDGFDFTQLNYEVMGQIFERLLSTTERHKFGQHYTRSEIVDLINAFCIRDGSATVLDPACGGGTFLVRAYQRKSDLSACSLSHEQLLTQLYGLDISAYPVHLTTINLATRNLIERANYPLIARQDFFRVEPGKPAFHVPLGGGEQLAWIEIPKVNAVVGNPPYVEQTKINEYYGKKYKDLLQEVSHKDAPEANLSGRSDIFCYFFTHGLAFLQEHGYMGLLTSSTWLDTTYGFRLQKFLLDKFQILAILESNCEPWFTAARVTTAATILKCEPDPEKRAQNQVKFVWIKKPLEELFGQSNSEAERQQAVETFRHEIEQADSDYETDSWRVRVRTQAELYRLGTSALDFADEEPHGSDNDEADQEDTVAEQWHFESVPEVQQSEAVEYIGYKWGIFVRAPKIFFTLLERCQSRLVPLGQVAEVRRGITSGCDAFFFPKDVTEEAVAEQLSDYEFRERYGVSRSETRRARIVRAGDGSVHLIEAKYLKPEVHTLMEVESIGLDPMKLSRKILLVPKTKSDLAGTHVLKYIRWGEQEGFHQRSTCASRARVRSWYDLSIHKPGDILWPLAHQYRHIIPINDKHLITNKRLFNVYPHDRHTSATLCAVLNSTIVALMKSFFGRFVGREGNLDTEVVDAKMMLVPDPRNITEPVRNRVLVAFDSMRAREALPLVAVDSADTAWTGELALQDRQQLDDAVLELLGISDSAERASVRDEVYRELTSLYRQIRIAERKMQKFRLLTARGGRPTPHSIAQEIWAELDPKPQQKSPLTLVSGTAQTEEIHVPVGRAKIIRHNLFQADGVEVGDTLIELGDPIRSDFLKQVCDLDISGPVRIPTEREECRCALDAYDEYVRTTNSELARAAAAYTADEHVQERVVKELWHLIRAQEPSPS